MVCSNLLIDLGYEVWLGHELGLGEELGLLVVGRSQLIRASLNLLYKQILWIHLLLLSRKVKLGRDGTVVHILIVDDTYGNSLSKHIINSH